MGGVTAGKEGVRESARGAYAQQEGVNVQWACKRVRVWDIGVNVVRAKEDREQQ